MTYKLRSRQEPLWWAKARRLVANGHSYANAGRLCGGRNHTSVKYAVDNDWRARRKDRMKGTPGKPDRHMTPEQNARRRLLNAAHAEAMATGSHVDQILVAWGSYPRCSRYSKPKCVIRWNNVSEGGFPHFAYRADNQQVRNIEHGAH